MSKKFLSIDYGSKFIGLASFNQGVDPFPLMEDRIQNFDIGKSLQLIVQIINNEFITDLIWGVPHLLDGSETSTTREIRSIGEKIKPLLEASKSPCQVHFFDETLSTYQAKETMKTSPAFNFKVDLRKVDSLSARIILEDFLKLNI